MPFLQEEFKSPSIDGRLRWFNEPARWRVDPQIAALVVEPDGHTDFWRKTHYGFEFDSGHLLYATIASDFVMTTKVRFLPVHQYDQAGLMVRADGNCWIKTSVEYELDEPPRLGAVVTNGGYSDWSVQNFDRGQNKILFRISRQGSDFVVEFSKRGEVWDLLRIAHLNIPAGEPVDCGVYACSPKGAGFRAEFEFLRIAI